MKLKEGIDLEDMSATIDNEGFWYAITNFIKPEDVLADVEQVKKVKEAIILIEEFEEVFPPL